MNAKKKENVLGRIFTTIWLGWVYAIEDTLFYYLLRSRESFEKMRNIISKESNIYSDSTYPIWRRGLSKARIKVVKQRLPEKEKKAETQATLESFTE